MPHFRTGLHPNVPAARGRCLGVIPHFGCVALVLLVSLLVMNSDTLAQFETVTNSGIPNLVYSSVAYGDYNNDGYLDLAVMGTTDTVSGPFDPSKFVARIYRNNGDGTFTDINANLTPAWYGSIAWGDYDNDGRLDLIYGGADGSGNQITKLYHNNGNGTFTENTQTVFHGSSYGSIAWGDYDNDGYLDIILSGYDNNQAVTQLYHNNHDGSFTLVTSAVFQGVNGESKVAWGDFDNDGYLDVALCGRTTHSWVTPQPVTKIYRNNGGNGTFTEVAATPLVGVSRGALVWADFNNDGLLDLLVSGITTGTDSTTNVRDTIVIYRNNGNGTFTGMNATNLPTATYANVSVGDYDGDGLIDVLINGYYSNEALYHNNGNFSFNPDPLTPGEIAEGGIAFGDINNDGYLDAIVTGVVVGTNRDTTLVYLNARSGTHSNYVANTRPNAPAGLSASVGPTQAALHWGRASDATTPTLALSYNLRIGSTSRGIQRLSPLADTTSGASNGFRRVARLGGTSMDSSWSLNNLTSGKYYWAVQAIDNAFAGSAFSTESYFSMPYTIAATAGPNGSISPSGSVQVSPDSSRKFTISPNTGYRVDSVLVDGAYVSHDTVYTFAAVSANHTIRAVFAQSIRASVKVYLEGPYVAAGDSMTNDLRKSGILASHFTGKLIPALAVDSINIEIRDTVVGAQAKTRRFASAWVLTNGSIRSFVDTTRSYVEFDSAVARPYYLVVRHRNHLPVMSASPDTVDARATPIVYDLSNAKTKAYSTTPLDSIAANRWALPAGDVNGSGTIVYNGADGVQSSNDRGQIYIRIGAGNVNATVSGYYNEDVNLSGTVVYNGADGSYPTNDRGMIYHSIGGGNVNVVRSNQVP